MNRRLSQSHHIEVAIFEVAIFEVAIFEALSTIVDDTLSVLTRAMTT